MGGVDWFKNVIIYHILIDRFAGFASTENYLNNNYDLALSTYSPVRVSILKISSILIIIVVLVAQFP